MERPAFRGYCRSLVRQWLLGLERWCLGGERWTDSEGAENRMLSSFLLIPRERQNMGIRTEIEAQRVTDHVISKQK